MVDPCMKASNFDGFAMPRRILPHDAAAAECLAARHGYGGAQRAGGVLPPCLERRDGTFDCINSLVEGRDEITAHIGKNGQ